MACDFECGLLSAGGVKRHDSSTNFFIGQDGQLGFGFPVRDPFVFRERTGSVKKRQVFEAEPEIPVSTEPVKFATRRRFRHVVVTPCLSNTFFSRHFSGERRLVCSEVIAREARWTEGFGRHGSRDSKPAAKRLQAKRCVPAASARRVPPRRILGSVFFRRRGLAIPRRRVRSPATACPPAHSVPSHSPNARQRVHRARTASTRS